MCPERSGCTGKGVSHCATCDAPLLRGRIVAVVGGGNSAMQEGLTLAECASKVIIFQRGDELTGQEYYRDRVTAHPKIEVRGNKIVSEIIGETTVTGLRIARRQERQCFGGRNCRRICLCGPAAQYRLCGEAD